MSTCETEARHTVLFGTVVCIALGLIFSLGASAGELEPRRPITTDRLPLTISEPGSYYLAEPISTSGGGIDLSYSSAAAQGVEILDVHLLNNGNGMRMYGESAIHRCTALYNNGIGIDAGFNSIVTDCVVRGTRTGTALITGAGTIVTRAEIRRNKRGGVVMGEGSQLLDSTVSTNEGHGIDATGDAVMIRNNMDDNSLRNTP